MDLTDCIQWKGKKLAHTVHYPAAFQARTDKFPLVIICHGFTSTRIGVDRLFVKTAQALVKLGFAVLRFDYAGCGESDGEYGENEFACFIDQTKTVISFGSELPNVDCDAITLIGHSLGGAVATCTASEDNRVGNVVVWSAVGKPFEDIKQIVGYDGEQAVIDHLGYAITEDFLLSLQAFAPIDEVRNVCGNVLIIHGTEDPVISSDYCRRYFEKALERSERSSEMVLVEGANHTFSSIGHFNQLIAATSEWLLKHAVNEFQNNLKKSV